MIQNGLAYDADGGEGFAERHSEGLDTLEDSRFHEEGARAEPICTPSSASTQHHYTRRPRLSQPIDAQDEPRP